MKKTKVTLLTLLAFGAVICSEQEVERKIGVEREEEIVKTVKYFLTAPDGYRWCFISLASEVSEKPIPALSSADYEKIKKSVKEKKFVKIVDGSQHFIVPSKEVWNNETYNTLISLSWHQKRGEEVKNFKEQLLAKVDKQEQYTDLRGGKYYITSLEQKLKDETEEALKFVGLDHLINNILLLGKKSQDTSFCGMVWADIDGASYQIPYAALFNIECLKRHSPVDRKVNFLNWSSRVKAICAGMSAGELYEVLASVYLLESFSKGENKNDTERDSFCSHYLNCANKSWPCLSANELLYYIKQISDLCNAEVIEFDALTYAKQIVADRKKPDYEQRIEEGVKKLLEAE